MTASCVLASQNADTLIRNNDRERERERERERVELN